MAPLRKAYSLWPRAGFSRIHVAVGTAVLLVGPSLLVGAPNPSRVSPAKGSPAAAAKANGAPKPGAPASNPTQAAPPEFADPFPSSPHPAAPDLRLSREEERRALALSEFAQALLAEDQADSEKALAGFRRALDADPSYTELALKVAFELARRNDVSSGIQILKDAIKAAPKESAPLLMLAQLYAKQLKKPELAIKYAEQALSLSPNDIACYSAVFEVQLACGQPKKAEQALERGTRLNHPDPKFWQQLGELYARLYLKEDGTAQPSELERMNSVFKKAGALGREDRSVLARVGDYFVLSRQLKEAIPLYQAALAQKKSSVETPTATVREKLARAYLASGQQAPAIELLEAMTAENPSRHETFELLGEIYEQTGQTDKALLNFEHSLLLESSEPRNFLRLTEMYLRAKRPEKAVSTMRTARARFRDRPEITFSLAISLSQAKQHTEAMTTFAEALGEATDAHEELLTAQFYFQYGAAAEQAGLTAKAAELLKRSIELDPPNAAQAYNYLGYMWADRGENLEEAATFIEKALEIDPENGAFLDSLGWLYFKKADHERALKELLRAVEKIKPEDAVVFDHLGDTYAALGKMREALTYWQKALALERDNKVIAAKIEAAQQKSVDSRASSDPR